MSNVKQEKDFYVLDVVRRVCTIRDRVRIVVWSARRSSTAAVVGSGVRSKMRRGRNVGKKGKDDVKVGVAASTEAVDLDYSNAALVELSNGNCS